MRITIACWLCLMCVSAGADRSAGGPRIDISADNGRSDVLAPGWSHWRVAVAAQSEWKSGDVSAKLAAIDPTEKLQAPWWKPGFDHPARMASDGVTAERGLKLTLRGLSPGRHTVATFHNLVFDAKPQTVTIAVGTVIVTVTPTVRIDHDDDAASAYLEINVPSVGESEVVITIKAESGPVILNGIEIDRPDPRSRARKTFPTDNDEHVPAGSVLTWQAGPKARRYHVYLGGSATEVTRADRSSPCFRGETTETRFTTTALSLDHRSPYFWRIDSVEDDRTVVGEVRRFRIRHPAFPQAEGYGRFAIGGRGGKVYEVTNLNDSGPGSLREAVEASGPRIAVFRIGGVIELKSKLVVRNPYLTVAGQTAPGDGICIANYTFGCLEAHDVIIRHIRIRIGDETGTTQDGSGSRGGDHIIFDHCSISWSIDEGFSSREARNLTVQRCLIAEALHLADHEKYKGTGKGHSFAGSISGGIGSFHHNLLAHCTGRNWSLAGGLDRTGQRLAGRLDIRNNVVYNWRDRTTDGGVRELNFVNNLYIPGPATKVFSLLKPDPNDWNRGMVAYMAGNVVEGKPAIAEDNWSAFVGPAEGRDMIRRAKPLFEPFVKTQSALDAYGSIISDVGATRPRQDAVDRRIIDDVRNRKHTYSGSKGKLPGIIDSQKDAGGRPRYDSGDAPSDRDHDGLPDAWENSHGLNPSDPADGSRFRRDGYTHLEHYLNELAEPTCRPSRDSKYLDTIRKRSESAVAAAQITEEAKRTAAVRIVIAHYVGINDIHFDRDQSVNAAESVAAVTAARSRAAERVAVVHLTFLKDLAATVTAEQAEAIMDKMTYDVRLLTFRNYCEMLPNLTDAQKQVIRGHLRAGRDEAIIAGNADEKHEKFRIAKGKIANYLSREGYDLKKAAAEWEQRRKQKAPDPQ